MTPEAELALLRSQVEKAEQERDLAIAHDTQPYPTAWAYEQLAKANEQMRGVVEAARALPIHGDADLGLQAELRFVADWLGDTTLNSSIRLMLDNWRGGLGYIISIRRALVALDTTTEPKP